MLIYVDRAWRRPTATALATVFEAHDAWLNGFTHIGTYRQAKKGLRQQLPAGLARRTLGVVPEKQRYADLVALVAARSATVAGDIAMEGPGGGNPFAGGGNPFAGGGNPFAGGNPKVAGGWSPGPGTGSMGNSPGGGWDEHGGVVVPGQEGRSYHDIRPYEDPDSHQNALDEMEAKSAEAIMQDTFSIPKNGLVVQGIQATTIVLGTGSSFVRLVPISLQSDSDAYMDGTCVQPRFRVYGSKGKSVVVHYGIRVDTAGGTSYSHKWDATEALTQVTKTNLGEKSYTIGDNGFAVVQLPRKWWRRGGVNETTRQVAVELSETTQTVDVEAHQDEASLGRQGFKIQ